MVILLYKQSADWFWYLIPCEYWVTNCSTEPQGVKTRETSVHVQKRSSLAEHFDPWLVGSTDKDAVDTKSLSLDGVVRVPVVALMLRLVHPSPLGQWNKQTARKSRKQLPNVAKLKRYTKISGSSAPKFSFVTQAGGLGLNGKQEAWIRVSWRYGPVSDALTLTHHCLGLQALLQGGLRGGQNCMKSLSRETSSSSGIAVAFPSPHGSWEILIPWRASIFSIVWRLQEGHLLNSLMATGRALRNIHRSGGSKLTGFACVWISRSRSWHFVWAVSLTV